MSEDIQRNLNCYHVGYLRICNDVIESRPQEEAVADALEKIQLCIHHNKCSKGVPISAPYSISIKRAPLEAYTKLIVSSIDGEYSLPLKGNIELVLLSKELIKHVLTSKPYLIGNSIDIVSTLNGANLAVRFKGKLIIPNAKNYRQIQDELLSVNSYTEVKDYLPFSFAFSYYYVKIVRKVAYALDIAYLTKNTTCKEKASRIECFKYPGSARCVFNNNNVCPLRVLHRKPTKRKTGGARLLLMFIESMLTKLEEVRAISKADYIASLFLTNYIKTLITALSIATKKMAELPIANEEEELLSSLKELEKIKSLSNNYRLRHFIDLITNDIGQIKSMDSPYKIKTSTIIWLDNFPAKLGLLKKLLLYDSIYSKCTPIEIPSNVIEGYLNTFFPIIKGQIAKLLSEKISVSLKLTGCVEPKDLEPIVSEGMSVAILNTLASKNLLQRIKNYSGFAYRAYI